MSQISHKAIVTAINKDKIIVKFERRASCAECSSKNSCALINSSAQTIEIPITSEQNYAVGQTVNIFASSQSGWIAVFFSYILPLIILLLTLFITYKITQNDEKSAIFSLISLFFYYFLLFFAQKRLKSKIKISIEPDCDNNKNCI